MKSPSASRPTIKDVARAANVSQSTVSYVLNRTVAADRISDATKQRIWTAVERLGYKINPIGRDLQRGYTNQVTLLIVSWNLATSHAATAMAMSRAASRHELVLTVQVMDDDQAACEFIRRTTLHNLGGLLVLWDSPAFDERALRQLASEGVPVVDLLPDNPQGISVVTADRKDAGFRSTRHLLDLGHRVVGFIGDTVTRPKTTIRKLEGYRLALKRAGLPFDQTLVQDVTEFGFEGGNAGLRKLFARRPDITGLFCINDAIALGAIDAAMSLGRNCPANFSVVGFGDSPAGGHSRPKLTTIGLSSDLVAEQTIKLILEQRPSHRFKPREVLLLGSLIVRESTGPAPC